MVWMIVTVLVVILVGVFLVTALFGAPYVPSRYREAREAFLKLKPLDSGGVAVDFGCGDGVVLLAAVDAGAKMAVGIEINPILALLAGWRCRKNRKIVVRCGNMLSVKLPQDMSVAYVFGLDRVMRMLKPRLEEFAREQKRDIWVVSQAFEFAGMKPTKRHGAYVLYRIRG